MPCSAQLSVTFRLHLDLDTDPVQKTVAEKDYHPPVQWGNFDGLAKKGLQLELAAIACGSFVQGLGLRV